jgi:hypothetical protein
VYVENSSTVHARSDEEGLSRCQVSALVKRLCNGKTEVESLVGSVMAAPHVKPSSIGVSCMSNVDAETLVLEV